MTRLSSGKTSKVITIRDVAKKAGTSIATVSYVLNNAKRYLRPDLQERVLQAAKELGYLKNAAASSLKGKRRGILAILVAQFGNSFFTRMCVDIEEVARREGYIVTICNSYEDPEQERIILERLVGQRIDGCILCTALSQEQNALFLLRHQVPFVILERSLVSSFPPYDFVGQDNFQSGYLATKRLLDAGHRHIAFLGWDSPIPNVRERVDGYRSALREWGGALDQTLIMLDDRSAEGGKRLAERVPLATVTGLVLGQHEIAKGTLLHFQEQGVYWPAGISIVMVGTPEWSGMLRPSLTCIKRPEQKMGYAAALLLLQKIGDPSHIPVQKLFPCTIVEGGSVQNI